jgi:hypothetical protein
MSALLETRINPFERFLADRVAILVRPVPAE